MEIHAMYLVLSEEVELFDFPTHIFWDARNSNSTCNDKFIILDYIFRFFQVARTETYSVTAGDYSLWKGCCLRKEEQETELVVQTDRYLRELERWLFVQKSQHF